MAESTRLLIVEDHIALAENLYEYFGSQNYVLDFAAEGFTAMHLVANQRYDVIVLDVMLNGISGFELCHKIRHELGCNTPIIFMTARDRLDDKELGFSRGGDDYLVKPFQLRELQLRVDALKRRNERGTTPLLQAGGVSFDPGQLRVTLEDGRSLHLSGTAASLFELLVRRYPNILTYEEIQQRLWGDRETELNNLRTHVYGLRKQLLESFGVPLIKTIHNRGYQLQCADTPGDWRIE